MAGAWYAIHCIREGKTFYIIFTILSSHKQEFAENTHRLQTVAVIPTVYMRTEVGVGHTYESQATLNLQVSSKSQVTM